MSRKPHVPTRTCPHRWCRPLHLAPIPFMLAVVAFDLWHNWRNMITVGLSIAVGIFLPKLVHYRRRHRTTPPTVRDIVDDLRASPTAIELEMEDAKYAGTGWRTLHVRKGWARVAVGCDVLVLTVLGIAAAAIFGSPSEAAVRSSSMTLDGGTLIAIVVGVAFFGFSLWAHKKATEPRKPKRVTVPVGMQTNS